MLNEKCQKAGWEKPLVDSVSVDHTSARVNDVLLGVEVDGQRANPGSEPTTFSGMVTLRKRVSKNVYDLESVRLVPHPPLEIATAAEAKHYAATYAMFRVSHLESWVDGFWETARSMRV